MYIAGLPPYLYISALMPSGPGAFFLARLFTRARICAFDSRICESPSVWVMLGPSYVLLQILWNLFTVVVWRCGVGFDPSECELTLYAAPEEAAEARRHEDAGVHRFVFGLPPAGADVLLPMLDTMAEVIDAVD